MRVGEEHRAVHFATDPLLAKGSFGFWAPNANFENERFDKVQQFQILANSFVPFFLSMFGPMFLNECVNA